MIPGDGRLIALPPAGRQHCLIGVGVEAGVGADDVGTSRDLVECLRGRGSQLANRWRNRSACLDPDARGLRPRSASEWLEQRELNAKRKRTLARWKPIQPNQRAVTENAAAPDGRPESDNRVGPRWRDVRATAGAAPAR